MTVAELIERLEEMQQTYGDDCEVKLMTQQAYPFENELLGITDSVEMGDDEDSEPVCYLVEGQQLGYGSTVAWEVVQ